MAFILSGTNIRRPHGIKEGNSTQAAVQRTLEGSINKDLFGSNKRTWTLSFENVKPADFSVINSIYQNYLSTGSTVTWQVTEASYPISQTNVHVSLQDRDFSVRGSSYISDFDLVLEEA